VVLWTADPSFEKKVENVDTPILDFKKHRIIYQGGRQGGEADHVALTRTVGVLCEKKSRGVGVVRKGGPACNRRQRSQYRKKGGKGGGVNVAGEHKYCGSRGKEKTQAKPLAHQAPTGKVLDQKAVVCRSRQ